MFLSLYFPVGQLVHGASPPGVLVWSEYVPWGQTTQADAEPKEYVPFTQDEHEAEPKVEYFPATQASHPD